MWAHVKWTPSLVPYRPASEGLTSDRHADVRRGMKEVESKRQRLTFCPPNEAVKISSPCRFSVPHQHTRTGIEWGKRGGGGGRSRWGMKQSALCEGQPSVATDSRQPIATQRSPFTINFRLQPNLSRILPQLGPFFPPLAANSQGLSEQSEPIIHL